MSKSINKKNDRTKKHFKQAFITLVHEKGFSNVTVKNIVERAQYNRTTFYLHYFDKFDLVDELMGEMYDAIKENSVSTYPINNRIDVEKMGPRSFELFYFIKENKDYFKMLEVADTLPNIHSQLPNAIFEVLNTHFHFHFTHDQFANHTQVKMYMAYGTSGLITEWIKEDFHKSTEEMTRELVTILRFFISDFVIKNTEGIL